MHIHTLFNPHTQVLQLKTSSWSRQQEWALAVGNFDGVHLGHQMLLTQLQQQAIARKKKESLCTAVMIFDPQPAEFFRGSDAPLRIMSTRDKIEALFAKGIDAVLVCSFDQALSTLEPIDFMDQLRVSLNVKILMVGEDFRFGCQRRGDVSFLASYCKTHNIHLSVMSDFKQDDLRISSSGIRRNILDFNFQQAAQSLGRPFFLTGTVAHGEKLARSLGFPTANLHVHPYSPRLKGVFVGLVNLPYNGSDLEQSFRYRAVANCGFRPSVAGQVWRIEIHIFDQRFLQRHSQDLYGIRVGFAPLALLRDEIRFDSLSALQSAISKDVAKAMLYFSAQDGNDGESR